MKKAFLLIIFGMTAGLNAQPFPYQQGENTLSLGVNAVFSYLGNFFSKNDNFVNQFLIPVNGNFIYRQFKSPATAVRHQFSLAFSLRETGTLTNGSSENFLSFHSSYLWGREKHIYLNKFNTYSFYSFGPRFMYSSSEFNINTQTNNQRITLIDGPVISALATAGIGLEYRFSQRFFIGAEASAQGFVNFSLLNKNEIRNELTNEVLKNENRNVINFSLLVVNPLLFRAGVRF